MLLKSTQLKYGKNQEHPLCVLKQIFYKIESIFSKFLIQICKVVVETSQYVGTLKKICSLEQWKRNVETETTFFKQNGNTKKEYN